MERFAIRAELKTPVGLDLGLMTLDAVLQSEAFQSGGDPQAIPLVRTGELWHASSAFLERRGDDPCHPMPTTFIAGMRAERELEEGWVVNKWGRPAKLGVVKKEWGGNVMNTYNFYPAAAVWWFAEGDADAVLNVLSEVLYLGKKRSAGWGAVSLSETFPATVDGVRDVQNKPLRPVPVDLFGLNSGQARPRIRDSGWKGFYWDVREREPCFVPESVIRTQAQLIELLA